MIRLAPLASLGSILVSGPLLAGQAPAEPGAVVLPFAIAGPPPPLPPATIARDATGRATLRATRLTTPVRIDGALDETVYENVPSATDFIQSEPAEGAPATEKTEVWVFFDKDAVYVVARCWETQPGRMISNEMRRDGLSIPRNESFAWSFDTFYDRRNSVFFELTPLGGRLDAQATNERSINTSWNPVWEFATRRFAEGWSLEAKIPFKSLRYRPGTAQVWGFQAKRRSQWKNESSYLGPVPAAFGGAGHFRAISLAPTLVGVEAPSGAKNLEIKPYVISSLTSNTAGQPRTSNEVAGDFGVDLKYGITQNVTADLTYNTDFAQVEADEQQVNLTRFSLFFPEKREFFLENQGTFDFGGAGVSPRGSGPGSNEPNVFADTPTLFYSRRIGLATGGQVVPIVAGGRLTGRVDRFSFGLLNIHANDLPTSRLLSTNFSVLRVKRDILRKSYLGLIYTRRSVSESGPGVNQTYGLDATFAFFDNLTINTYWAQAKTKEPSDGDASYRAQLDYNGDRYGLQLERLRVERNFNPEMGFVRRPNMLRSFASARFSPRPRRNKHVRKLFWTGSIDHIESATGRRLETRIVIGTFDVELQNGDKLTLGYSRNHEFLPVPLSLIPAVSVPVGSYDFQTVKAGFSWAQTRKVASGAVTVERGSFFGGDKTTVTVSQGRLAFPPYLTLEPSYSLNSVDLPQGAFTTHLLGPRVNLTITPWTFVGALLQYNSTAHSVSSNVRFRWEYRPGSELFVVYNDQRDTLTRGFPDLSNRAFIVKVNQLLRF